MNITFGGIVPDQQRRELCPRSIRRFSREENIKIKNTIGRTTAEYIYFFQSKRQ